MYGIINIAIEGYVVATFGTPAWENIKKRIGLTLDFSTVEQPYNDDVTYRLAEATSEETKTPIDELLTNFGEYMILATHKNYNAVMDSRGSNLKDYLVNLPNFHNRMMLIYPELTPPVFRISNISNNSMQVHYFSKTPGIRNFVIGYLNGLVKIFNEPATVEVIQSKDEGNPEDVFKIHWHL